MLAKGVPTRLSVEIHNEGLMISYNGKSSNTDNVKGADFIPNGLNARRFLHSLVCGEVPSHHIMHNICGFGSDKQQEGLMRATVTDMRVDDETAILQVRNNRFLLIALNLSFSLNLFLLLLLDITDYVLLLAFHSIEGF